MFPISKRSIRQAFVAMVQKDVLLKYISKRNQTLEIFITKNSVFCYVQFKHMQKVREQLSQLKVFFSSSLHFLQQVSVPGEQAPSWWWGEPVQRHSQEL